MKSDPLITISLKGLLERIRSGDPAARNELLQASETRLQRLAHRMLRGHASVRRWADTGDVVQNASLRLLRALEGTPVANTRDYFNLAAAVIRRELIDLARHYYGNRGIGANHASHATNSGQAIAPEGEIEDPDPTTLDRWAALHEAAERLPVEQREVFGLTFYHGWTQDQIAELFQIDVRTVRRRWQAAIKLLHDALGGELPEG